MVLVSIKKFHAVKMPSPAEMRGTEVKLLEYGSYQGQYIQSLVIMFETDWGKCRHLV